MTEALRKWTYDGLGKPSDLKLGEKQLLVNGRPVEQPGMEFAEGKDFAHILLKEEGMGDLGFTLVPVRSPLRLKIDDLLRKIDDIAFGWIFRLVDNQG